MKILLLLILDILFLIASKPFFNKKSKGNLEGLIVLFSLNFTLSISEVPTKIVGEWLTNTLNSGLIAIIAYFFVYTIKRIKIGWEILIVIPFSCSIFYQIRNGLINDIPDFIRLASTYLAVFLILCIIKNTADFNGQSIFYYVCILSNINSILGILQIITKKALTVGNFNGSILYTEGSVNAYRAIGIAGSNNSAGNLAAIFFPVLLYCYIKKQSYSSLCTVLLNLIFVYLTLTRIAMLGIIVELVIFYFGYRTNSYKQTLIKLTSGFVGIASVTIILLVYGSRIINKLFVERGSTQNSRFVQYALAWTNGVSQHLLNGIGLGQWRYYIYVTSKWTIVDLQIHSQYYSVLVEQGLFIFIIFVVLNFILLRNILKQTIPYELKLLAITLFVGNIIVSNFNPNEYYFLNNVIYYFIMFSLMFWQTKNNKEKDVVRGLE